MTNREKLLTAISELDDVCDGYTDVEDEAKNWILCEEIQNEEELKNWLTNQGWFNSEENYDKDEFKSYTEYLDSEFKDYLETRGWFSKFGWVDYNG